MCVEITTAAAGTIPALPVQTSMVGCLLSCEERESRSGGSGRRQEERVTLPGGLHDAFYIHTLKCCLSSSLVYCVWPTAGSFTSCCPVLWEITSLSSWHTWMFSGSIARSCFSANATAQPTAFCCDSTHIHTHVWYSPLCLWRPNFRSYVCDARCSISLSPIVLLLT